MNNEIFDKILDNSMDQLRKINAMHKAIMSFVASEIVIKAGELNEAWGKGDHINHNSDILLGQIKIFQRQLPNTLKAIENEDKDLIKKSLEMYKKDREKLKFDIQYDRINSELFEPLREYIQSLNDLIIALEEIL